MAELRACPKPPPRQKKKRSKIRIMKERFDPKFWPQMSLRVRKEQDGRCGYCFDVFGVNRLVAAHIIGLGRGRSRNDKFCQQNRRENLIGMCVKCHAKFDGDLSRSEREWMQTVLANLTALVMGGKKWHD